MINSGIDTFDFNSSCCAVNLPYGGETLCPEIGGNLSRTRACPRIRVLWFDPPRI
jgi:hypothetical protein